VTGIDGQTFRNVFDIYSYILNKEIGDQMVIQYNRDGHGMPAINVALNEKHTRYFGTETYVAGSGSYTGDLSWYTSDLTY
jgi:PDZ domain-containing secreted protein